MYGIRIYLGIVFIATNISNGKHLQTFYFFISWVKNIYNETSLNNLLLSLLCLATSGTITEKAMKFIRVYVTLTTELLNWYLKRMVSDKGNNTITVRNIL